MCVSALHTGAHLTPRHSPLSAVPLGEPRGLCRPFHVSPALGSGQRCQQISHLSESPSHRAAPPPYAHTASLVKRKEDYCVFELAASPCASVRVRARLLVGVARRAPGLSYQRDGKAA